MAKSRVKIALVGGGSVSWIPSLVRDIILIPALADSEFALLDIDKSAAERVKTLCVKIAAAAGVNAKFNATDRRATALRGAQYVIITISTGGLDAMAHDLKIPERFSVYHTVGDTLGPGGWARTIRNFDVFKSLGEDFKRYAPGAMVLNYTNPMTTLTDILARLHDGPVVGLCHGLFESLEFLRELYKQKHDDDINVKYAGVNHFFWITEAKAAGKDLLADLKRRLKKNSFADLFEIAYAKHTGSRPRGGVLATELFRATGAVPYIADRHTSEFVPHCITSETAVDKYKLKRTFITDRRRGFRRTRKQVQQFTRKLPDWYLNRGREAASDMINAHLLGVPFLDVGNTANIGQVSNLPLGAVLETAVRIDATGVSPITFGPLPDPILAMVERVVHVQRQTVDACFAGDQHAALQALRLDPVCSHLHTDKVYDLGNRLLAAHKKFISAF